MTKVVLYRTNTPETYNAETREFSTKNEPKTSHIEEGNLFIIAPTNKAKAKGNIEVVVGTLTNTHDTSKFERTYKLKEVTVYEDFAAVLVDYPAFEGVGGKIRVANI